MSDSPNQTDGSPDAPPPGDGAMGYSAPSAEDEVSLLDILLVLVRKRTLILQTVLVVTLLGLTYAVLAPEEYTSRAKVVREAQEESGGLPGGLSGGALRGLGISLGSRASGLTPAAFPEVLESREVRLAVARDTFRFPDADRPMTFVEYVSRPPGMVGRLFTYTLGLPWTLKDALGNAISDAPAPAGTTEAGEPVIPSPEENQALKTLAGMVSASVNQESGLMTISVTAGGPRLAADIAQSFVKHLTRRVREIRTEKVQERLQFVEERFDTAEAELEAAENRLAQFLERNQNPTSAALRFQRDRLQRQVSFKEQLYSELQSQLTQTRLDLQRRQPVATVVEEPVPPMSRSAPRRTFLVLLSMLVGGVLGVAIAFGTTFLENAEQKDGASKKMQELREALGTGVLGTVHDRLRRLSLGKNAPSSRSQSGETAS